MRSNPSTKTNARQRTARAQKARKRQQRPTQQRRQEVMSPEDPRLRELAQEVSGHLRAAVEFASRCCEQMVAAGRALSEARALLKEQRGWLAWIGELKVSRRTVERCIRMVGIWDKIQANQKTGHVPTFRTTAVYALGELAETLAPEVLDHIIARLCGGEREVVRRPDVQAAHRAVTNTGPSEAQKAANIASANEYAEERRAEEEARRAAAVQERAKDMEAEVEKAVIDMARRLAAGEAPRGDRVMRRVLAEEPPQDVDAPAPSLELASTSKVQIERLLFYVAPPEVGAAIMAHDARHPGYAAQLAAWLNARLAGERGAEPATSSATH